MNASKASAVNLIQTAVAHGWRRDVCRIPGRSVIVCLTPGEVSRTDYREIVVFFRMDGQRRRTVVRSEVGRPGCRRPSRSGTYAASLLFV